MPNAGSKTLRCISPIDGTVFVEGPLLDAAGSRQVVSFTYRAASTGDVLERRVEPWSLLARRGGWYLVGRDVVRDAPRVYRLSRIQGPVRTHGAPGAFTVPADADPRAVLKRSGHDEMRTAWLAIAPGRAGALRARAVGAGSVPAAPAPGSVPAGLDLVAVPYTRTGDLADEVTAYTDAVVVLAPSTLRDSVVRRLTDAARLADLGGPERDEASTGEEQHG